MASLSTVSAEEREAKQFQKIQAVVPARPTLDQERAARKVKARAALDAAKADAVTEPYEYKPRKLGGETREG